MFNIIRRIKLWQHTTFTGPVRSENGFSTIVKSSTTGAITNSMTFLSTLQQ
jgi:hypothetical protein